MSFIFIIIIYIIIILLQSHRQPFDQSEVELEIIAGFLTDFSSYLFVILLLTEYLLIIIAIIMICFILHIYYIFTIIGCYFISLSRSLFVRFRYDLLIHYL